MNIFVLDRDPELAAAYLCDKHCVKMPLESAQMLSTVVNSFGIETEYKPTHAKHPCTIWTAESLENFLWHSLLAVYLCREYTFRYGKKHKSQSVIEKCTDICLDGNIKFERKEMTDFAQAMPEECKDKDAVVAYRKYYMMKKNDIAKWNKCRSAPEWWVI